MENNFDVTITAKARSDISQITDCVAQYNQKAASDIVYLLKITISMIAKYPETGIKKSGIKDSSILFYTIRKKYTIAYRIKANRIEILRILTRYQDIFTIL